MEPNVQQQPGQTVTPTGATSGQPAPAPGPSAPVAPTPPQPQPQASVPDQAPASTPAATPADDTDPNAIIWTASEFIAHDKSLRWYAGLVAAAAALAALVFLISRDFISVGVVVVASLLLAIYGSRQPRQLEYRLDSSGLAIGQKSFAYDEFRSFSILPEGAFSSIVFMPLKRFAVPTTIYYAPQDEDKIVKLLSDRLPLEKRDHDAVDRLMHRIRF